MKGRGILHGLLRYLFSRFRKPRVYTWEPSLSADTECIKEELSARFWEATAGNRQEFRSLGFSERGFKKLRNNLNRSYRDDGCIDYVNRDQTHYGKLHYIRSHVSADRETLVISFSAVFPAGVVTHTNTNATALFEGLPEDVVVRHPSVHDATVIYDAFLKDLERRTEKPRRFDDEEAFRRWSDARQIEIFQMRVASGLFLKMTDDEVEAARRKLPPQALPPPLPTM